MARIRDERDYVKQQSTAECGAMGLNTPRPMNDVERLEVENEKLRALLKEQEAELLSLYRRLLATDRPYPGY